jgi:imidazolonepropionase-like amidohydrolase
MEAIRAATSTAAGCCNLADAGRIEPGMRPDLIAVDDDPIDEIELLEDATRIALVVRDGRTFKNTIGGEGGGLR